MNAFTRPVIPSPLERTVSLFRGYLSINQDFICLHNAHKKGDVQVFGLMTMALCSSIINPIIARGKMTNADDERHIRAYCVEVLAGPLAESVIASSDDMIGGAIDAEQARQVIDRVFPKRKDKVKFLKSVFAEANEFVQTNRATIFHFAEALFDRETILGDDIDKTIANALISK